MLPLILQALIIRFGGTDTQIFPFPLSDTKMYRIGGVMISQLSLGTMGVSILASALFYILVQKTHIGLAMRGTSKIFRPPRRWEFRPE